MGLKVIDGETNHIITEKIKTCATCGHAKSYKCNLSGFYQETERKYPSRCGHDFKGWIPKPPKVGLFSWIRSIFYGDA